MKPSIPGTEKALVFHRKLVERVIRALERSEPQLAARVKRRHEPDDGAVA